MQVQRSATAPDLRKKTPSSGLFFIIYLWQFTVLLQQLYYYNTLSVVSTALLLTANCHFFFFNQTFL